MNDAPRWPGADGAPGLSFAPKDAVAPEVAEESVADAAEVTAASVTPEVDFVSPTKEELADTSETSAQAEKPEERTVAEEIPSGQPEEETRRSKFAFPESWKERLQLPDNVAAAAGVTTPIVARGTRRTRKARLRIDRIDPWTVMKTSFLFSIAFAIIIVASVAVLWSVFAGSDTMEYINNLVHSLMATEDGGATFDVREILGWQRVIGLTTVIAAVDVVIFTAVATLFSFLYNLSAIIMGGLEITLAED